MKKLFSLLIILSGPFYFVSAQSECNNFHRKNCDLSEGVSMSYDSQSKSAVMAKGQTSAFHFVAYNGLDYRISVCADEILGGQLQFKIFEKKRVLIKEDEYSSEPVSSKTEPVEEVSEEEAYTEDSYDAYSEDSYSYEESDNSYSESSSSDSEGDQESTGPKFRIEKELLYDNADDSYAPFIEFTAEGSKSLLVEVSVPGTKAGGRLKIAETGCVGVLIEHSKSRHTGFN